MQKFKIDPALLIHDMQNHDEFTYELVHFMEHPDEMFNFGGKQMSGKEIRDKIISQMHHLAIGVDTPYNRLSGNGLCTTYACLMASRMRISSIEKISKEQANIIKKGHYLMAIYNAMQPGVFGISAWDMVGALNIPTNEIPELLKDGDFRWINRGSVELMGDNEDVKESFDGMPRCKTLYKSVPKQLEDKDSFLSLIKNLIEKRNEYKIHLGSSISYPKVKNIGAAIMVHNIEQGLQVTALNFGNDDIVETINLVAQGKVKLENIANKQIFDIITNENLGFVDDSGNLKISLRSLEGKALIFK
jgi:trehalose synthase